MKHLFVIILIYLLPAFGTAQSDSSSIEVRSFSSQQLKELKNDSDFQYDNLKEPAISWWQRFWVWFWWKVAQIMQTKSGRTTVWSVLVFIGLIVLVFAIFKIRKMNKAGMFVRSSNSGLDYTVGHEDIHQISFENAIADAIEKKNYRLAVRLLYLQTLKVLTDKQAIEWKLNKTNSDYVREVSAKPWQSIFSKLTYQFEFTWYGEASVTPERFEVLRQEFKQLHNLV